MDAKRISSKDRVYEEALGLAIFQIPLPIIVGGLFTILQIQPSLLV
jgi:hypothetical protein